MNSTEEAAAILTRVFEALARANGKTLNTRTRADIGRACELLASAGSDLTELLDELPVTPKTTRGEAASNFIAAAESDPNFQRWRQARDCAEADRK